MCISRRLFLLRVYALIGKRYLPKWVKAASLHNLIFQYDDMDKLIRKEREPAVKKSQQNLEQAIAYYDKAADLFQGEEVTTSTNQCKQKLAQFSAQLQQSKKGLEDGFVLCYLECQTIKEGFGCFTSFKYPILSMSLKVKFCITNTTKFINFV